jgi:hypothetical protein
MVGYEAERASVVFDERNFGIQVLKQYNLNSEYFGEGLALFNHRFALSDPNNHM